jgi:hypothetical protein
VKLLIERGANINAESKVRSVVFRLHNNIMKKMAASVILFISLM